MAQSIVLEGDELVREDCDHRNTFDIIGQNGFCPAFLFTYMTMAASPSALPDKPTPAPMTAGWNIRLAQSTSSTASHDPQLVVEVVAEFYLLPLIV